jgi:dTDP-glucose 4,6-dehydratase
VNVGTPDEMTVLQIAQEIIAAAGSSAGVRFIPAVVDDPRVRRPDTTLIETKLGWHPSVDWPTGIKRTIGWFREREPEKAGYRPE